MLFHLISFQACCIQGLEYELSFVAILHTTLYRLTYLQLYLLLSPGFPSSCLVMLFLVEWSCVSQPCLLSLQCLTLLGMVWTNFFIHVSLLMLIINHNFQECYPISFLHESYRSLGVCLHIFCFHILGRIRTHPTSHKQVWLAEEGG